MPRPESDPYLQKWISELEQIIQDIEQDWRGRSSKRKMVLVTTPVVALFVIGLAVGIFRFLDRTPFPPQSASLPPTPIAVVGSTPSPMPLATPTLLPSPTSTSTPTPTATPTSTPTFTPSPTLTPTPYPLFLSLTATPSASSVVLFPSLPAQCYTLNGTQADIRWFTFPRLQFQLPPAVQQANNPIPRSESPTYPDYLPQEQYRFRFKGQLTRLRLQIQGPYTQQWHTLLGEIALSEETSLLRWHPLMAFDPYTRQLAWITLQGNFPIVNQQTYPFRLVLVDNQQPDVPLAILLSGTLTLTLPESSQWFPISPISPTPTSPFPTEQTRFDLVDQLQEAKNLSTWVNAPGVIPCCMFTNIAELDRGYNYLYVLVPSPFENKAYSLWLTLSNRQHGTIFQAFSSQRIDVQDFCQRDT